MHQGAAFSFFNDSVGFSIPIVYPTNNARGVVIQQEKMISASRRICFVFTSKKQLQYFDWLPLEINTFMSSFNNENNQCIAAHLFCFYIQKTLQHFDCLPLKINTFLSSLNKKNDQCINAHLFWFDPPPNLINCLAKTALQVDLKPIFIICSSFFTK